MPLDFLYFCSSSLGTQGNYAAHGFCGTGLHSAVVVIWLPYKWYLLGYQLSALLRNLLLWRCKIQILVLAFLNY